MKKDARSELDMQQSININTYTASANGVGVGITGFYGVVAVVSTGTITDGTYTFKLQESDNNSTFTDVNTKDLKGTFSNVDNSKSNSIQRIGYMGLKKYVRVAVTVAGATVGGTFGASIIRAYPGNKPLP